MTAPGRLALARAAGYGGTAGLVDTDLAALAVREQVAPLLGARVREGSLEAAPDASAILLRAHHECLAQSLVRDRSAAPILAAVRAQGIPVMWLKGAALVHDVYKDPGRRWMGDLDVLVPADRWREAREAALAAGAESMAVPGRALTADRDYVAAFRAPGGAVVELHRYLGPRPLFAVDYDAMLQGGRSDGRGFLVPDRADLFVSLALHAAKHGFILAFRGVIDGLALAAAGVDHAAVTDRARAWRARRATAVWIEMLIHHGLPADPWRRAADRLGGGVARVLAAGTPFRPGERHLSRLARIACSADGPAAAAGYLLQRVALRVGDAVHAVWS